MGMGCEALLMIITYLKYKTKILSDVRSYIFYFFIEYNENKSGRFKTKQSDPVVNVIKLIFGGILDFPKIKKLRKV